MFKFKKSQTEILGLAIVIVFITVGMLFVVKFMVNQKDDNTRETFIRSELANNILGSVIDANTICRNLDMADILIDCAESYPYGSSCFNDTRTCEFAGSTLDTIFSNFMASLGGNRSFRFFATTPDMVDIVYVSFGNCSVWESSTQPLYTSVGVLELKFHMCS